jgi:hypothetical protein
VRNVVIILPTNIIQELKSRRMRWARPVVHRGERRGVYRVLVGKHEGLRPLERLRHK